MTGIWFSSQMNAACLAWLQLTSLVIGEWLCAISLLILNVVLGINQSFGQLLCLSLWSEHGGHSSGFWRGILIVTFWFAEAGRVIDSPGPSISRMVPEPVIEDTLTLSSPSMRRLKETYWHRHLTWKNGPGCPKMSENESRYIFCWDCICKQITVKNKG